MELIGRLKSAVALIDLAVASVGSTDEASFRQDRLLIDATAYRVLHIGEAVSALPETFKSRHPFLPWRRMIGMRHRLAHDYDGIDPALVWRTIREHLGELRAVCVRQLAADNNLGE